MIPVLVYDKDQCDPKKCTAKRMEKFGLAREVPLNRIPPGAIVLSPFAEKTLSPADLRYAGRGLVVMDMTWTHIGEMPRVNGAKARKLPYLVAANPVNYGKPRNLNSAEAVLASLIIMCQDEQAELFMPRFNWAPTFATLNRELLDGYREAKDSDDAQRMSDEYVESIMRRRRAFHRKPRIGIWPVETKRRGSPVCIPHLFIGPAHTSGCNVR